MTIPSLRQACFAALLIVSGAAAALASEHPGDPVADARAMLSALPLHDLEGIWQFTTDGSTVLIVRREGASPHAPFTYEMRLLGSASPLAAPGTLLGIIRPTAKPGLFDASLAADTRRPASVHHFILTLEDAAHLSFSEAKKGIRISPLILFPRFLRRGFREYDTTRPDIDGCIKIYPPVPVKGAPRYL